MNILDADEKYPMGVNSGNKRWIKKKGKKMLQNKEREKRRRKSEDPDKQLCLQIKVLQIEHRKREINHEMLLTSSKSIEESIQQSGHEAHVGYHSEPCNMSPDTSNLVIRSEYTSTYLYIMNMASSLEKWLGQNYFFNDNSC